MNNQNRRPFTRKPSPAPYPKSAPAKKPCVFCLFFSSCSQLPMSYTFPLTRLFVVNRKPFMHAPAPYPKKAPVEAPKRKPYPAPAPAKAPYVLLIGK